MRSDLEVDVTVGQSAGTAFIQEVDVFDQEAEERNHNLEKKKKKKDQLHLNHLFTSFKVLHYLLLAAVTRLRPLGGAAESSAVITEVTGGIHLMLHVMRPSRC